MHQVRRLMIALVCALALAALPSTASAHPGNTDNRGGHTCSTNCEQYGLGYGEYHFHNGGGSTGSSGTGSAGTSVVTQEDCDNRRIRRHGRTLSQDECEKLIGQRVSLADTGFEAWIFGAAGGLCLLLAVALRRSRPRTDRLT
jgi:hypothetical protein